MAKEGFYKRERQIVKQNTIARTYNNSLTTTATDTRTAVLSSLKVLFNRAVRGAKHSAGFEDDGKEFGYIS